MTWTACLDFETTGLVDPAPVSVAVVRAERGCDPVVVLSMLINPGKPIEPGAQAVHGISDKQVANASLWPDAAAMVLDSMEGCSAIACHNAPFDVPILRDGAAKIGRDLPTKTILCTLVWARALWWGMRGRPPTMKLTDVSTRLGVKLDNAHNAEADAVAVARILRPLHAELLDSGSIGAADDLAEWTAWQGAEHEARLAEWFHRPNARFWESVAPVAVGGAA